MKEVTSYSAQIWVGLRVQYSELIHDIDEVRDLCDQYVNEEKQCVTITETEFRYVDGWEPGVIVGFVNYPRYPMEPKEIKARALQLAEILMYGLDQYRVTVTFLDKTVMLENEKFIEK